MCVSRGGVNFCFTKWTGNIWKLIDTFCNGQVSRFNCIINYGTQIVYLKKSQSVDNIMLLFIFTSDQ